jgi:hypothetical protein
MNKTCSGIQRELDEWQPDDELGVKVTEHLAGCLECSDFHLKHTRLRQLVGSLGTVPAPADFDFRLRARLAKEKTSRSNVSFWSLPYKAVAAALLVALLVGASYVIFQKTRSEGTINNTISNNGKAPLAAPSAEPTQEQTRKVQSPIEAVATSTGPSSTVVQKRGNPIVIRNKRPAAVAEFSSTQATSVRKALSNSNEGIFPVDASQQSLRVSLYDSQGNARTISLPTVSFGSQRVVPTATSFAPKGVW